MYGLPVFLVMMLSLLSATAAGAETVTFPSGGITINGELFRPAGKGPFPAVVALHGCAGLYSRRGELSARHADWARRLAAAGFLVLFPDSYGSRDLGPQCRMRNRAVRPARERVADAEAARAYLQRRTDVKPGAISLLGWSNGGSTVLYAVERRHRPVGGTPDFAVAIAFYPGCRAPLESGTWNTRLPLHILIGGADDWTPAAPCLQLAETGGRRVSVTVYRGAYHDFDHPGLRLHALRGMAYSRDGTGIVHTGTDIAGREDALQRVPRLLAR
jgi:dienelactone hydrolase